MMSRKQKLELRWIGKDSDVHPEPRILVEEPSSGHYAAVRRDGDVFDNMLIQGDNLLALKALQPEHTGKLKCCAIDPPYNTGSAFEQFDDGIEHSQWLSLMQCRLEIIRELLSESGSVWVCIDDRECHYLKVMMDEIFGRRNFITSVIWRKNYSPKSTARHFSEDHDYILVYAKDADKWRPNPMPRSAKQNAAYRNPDSDPRGPWKPSDLSARNYYSKGTYVIRTPSGRVIPGPPNKNYWRVEEARFWEMDRDRRIWWGRDGSAIPQIKRFLSEVKEGVTPQTFWSHEEVGHTQEAKQESIALFGEQAFATPKPERLMQRIISIATDPGDIVLDSFAGSGTTGAVAQKMGRRWIMVELGQHARTHVAHRLSRVVDGTDSGGVTALCEWIGGGGYRFFRLAPSLLERDRWGNWVVSKEYNPAMLAEAMCKHMGFVYAPSQSSLEYWNHGYSSERDFIYVTTQALTHSMLKALSHDVGPDRHLLICCKAFSGKTDGFTNLTVRRIPQAVLANCEWGRDDYSLKIANLPKAETVGEDEPPPEQASLPKRGRPKAANGAASDLFGQPAEAQV
jgi:adenine-specific DNA-methyltransferase